MVHTIYLYTLSQVEVKRTLVQLLLKSEANSEVDINRLGCVMRRHNVK